MEKLRFSRAAKEAKAECRNAWIEDRIHFLAESFAVSIYSYAAISNNTHIVLSVDLSVVLAWSDEEVVDRWLSVFPGAMSKAASDQQRDWIRRGYFGAPDRIQKIRERLGSLSWIIRALNEPIARLANQKEGRTRGRSIRARFFRCAETTNYAFPTLDVSGKAASSARPCWNPGQWVLPWPTPFSIWLGPRWPKRWIPLTTPQSRRG